MQRVFGRPQSLADVPFHYCPGCSHGIVHRLIAECLDELGVRDRAVGIAPVGCAVFAYNYFNCDMIQAAHGRAPAVATGVKRTQPDAVVFTYQGDGDLAAIGAAEIIHAASRGERITVVFVNNAIYGMTGGQMAPTTLVGQKTTTSPRGRDAFWHGHPLRIPELLALVDGTAYVARVSVHGPGHVNRAKRALRRAFEVQLAGQGFSLVEVVSACPTNWGMSAVEALRWMEEHMLPYYRPGEFRVPGQGEA